MVGGVGGGVEVRGSNSVTRYYDESPIKPKQIQQTKIDLSYYPVIAYCN